jgi:hypothetical protein
LASVVGRVVTPRVLLPRAIEIGEALADLDRPGQQHARRRALACAFGQRREHAFLELRTEAAHGADALRQRGLAQLLQRVHAELGVQQARPLCAETGQARDRNQTRRELGAQPLRRRDSATVEQREDLLFQRRADTRQLARAAIARQRRDRQRGVAHAPRGRAVGQHAVNDRAVELVQVAELLQGVGDHRV